MLMSVDIPSTLQAQEEAPTSIDGTIKGLTPVSDVAELSYVLSS
jgi:hypothetical protein